MRFKELDSRISRQIHFKTSERMDEVATGSIQSVITSPPYWNLKDYGSPDQIGFRDSYEDYLSRLDQVWSECFRTLRDGGVLWIVIDKISEKGAIVHIPFDITQHCSNLGFKLRDIVIWNKPTAIAGMNSRNVVNKNEYVLVLAKPDGKDLHCPHCTTSIESGKQPDYTSAGLLTDLWRVPVKAGSIRKTPDHKAPYPDELIRRIVLLSTNENDWILDPFLGSGTTMKVALSLKRNCVGYEINSSFGDIIATSLHGVKPVVAQSRLTDAM